MAKISEYQQKTVFNDDDLYDCSTKNGAIYETESVTFSTLKDAIVDGLIPSTLTKSPLTIADLGTNPSYKTGSFVNTTDLDGYSGYYIMGKIAHVFLRGTIVFNSGGTGGTFSINLPANFPLIDNDLTRISFRGEANPVVFNYISSTGAIVKDEYGRGQASIRAMDIPFSTREVIVSVENIDSTADTLYFTAQATVPLA